MKILDSKVVLRPIDWMDLVLCFKIKTYFFSTESVYYTMDKTKWEKLSNDATTSEEKEHFVESMKLLFLKIRMSHFFVINDSLFSY